MIKKIIISVIIAIAAAGITFGALYYIKSTQTTPVENTPDAATSKKLVFDLSKDYGACTLLDAASIKTALGSIADNLQAPINAGITPDSYFGDGVEEIVSDSQTCTYAFAPGSKTDETLSAANGFIVRQTVYTNTDGPKALIEQVSQNPIAIAVESLGDAAFYMPDTSAEGPDATESFTLLVFNKNKSTTYSIIQPSEGSTLTADSAKTALLTLAK